MSGNQWPATVAGCEADPAYTLDCFAARYRHQHDITCYRYQPAGKARAIENCAHVRALLAERQPALARALDDTVRAI